MPSSAGSTARAALLTDPDFAGSGSCGYACVDAASITCSSWFHGLCIGTMSATLPSGGTTALTLY